jgi:hypothetical protein
MRSFSGKHDRNQVHPGPDRESALALLSNSNIALDRELLAAILAAFPDDSGVHQAMIGRDRLPDEVVLKLGILVAEERLPTLIARHVAPEGAIAQGLQRRAG